MAARRPNRPKQITLFETTRDASQGPRVSFTKEGKLRIAEKASQMGIPYIEVGCPGASPEELDTLHRAAQMDLGSTQVAGFIFTRRPYTRVEEDPGLRAALKSGARVMTVVGKCSARHVEKELGADLEENLRMVQETIRYLLDNGVERVFFAAEFYFLNFYSHRSKNLKLGGGFKRDSYYALRVIEAAVEAGAYQVILCDTMGAGLVGDIERGVKAAYRHLVRHVGEGRFELGIHAHNDSELAVAVTLAAVKAGATIVQITIGGLGERSGNTHLAPVVIGLEKMGFTSLSPEGIQELVAITRLYYREAGLSVPPALPVVGRDAFSHGGGTHISGITKDPSLYEYLPPDAVGGHRNLVMSLNAGKAAVQEKARELGVTLAPEHVKEIVKRLKEDNNVSVSCQASDVNFLLLMLTVSGSFRPPFIRANWKVTTGGDETSASSSSEAVVSVLVKQRRHTDFSKTTSGPVNAMHTALLGALSEHHPEFGNVKLIKYEVVNINEGTEATVKITIDFAVGNILFRTAGVSKNSLKASFRALTYGLYYYYYLHTQGRV